VDAGSPFHDRAKTWIERVLNGRSRVGLPWQSLGAFLRLSTHPRVFQRPLRPARAWELVERWLESDVAWIPGPTDRHAEILGDLIRRYRIAADLVPDAQLAALALEHGLAVYSADTDFARFSEIRWENPLAD
jgi:toxin-antitoxin system PIN domain toxin